MLIFIVHLQDEDKHTGLPRCIWSQSPFHWHSMEHTLGNAALSIILRVSQVRSGPQTMELSRSTKYNYCLPQVHLQNWGLPLGSA